MQLKTVAENLIEKDRSDSNHCEEEQKEDPTRHGQAQDMPLVEDNASGDRVAGLMADNEQNGE